MRHQFRATNPRVLENQKKFDDLHARYTEAMQGPNLETLKQIIVDEGIVCPISGTKNWTRRSPVQPDVLYPDGCCQRCYKQGISPS